MSNLTPEKRQDKNGRLVTKHVRSNGPDKRPSAALGVAPKLGGGITGFFGKRKHEKEQREYLAEHLDRVIWNGSASGENLVKKIDSPEVVDMALDIAETFRASNSVFDGDLALQGLVEVIRHNDSDSSGIRGLYACKDFIATKVDEKRFENPNPMEIYRMAHNHMKLHRNVPEESQVESTYTRFYSAIEDVFSDQIRRGEGTDVPLNKTLDEAWRQVR